MAIQTVNPFTNKVVRSFEMTDKAVDMLVAQSAKHIQFMERNLAKRAQILHKSSCFDA
jgi:succinate-semialdehyde dehydrogenase/glutarate-semialdehyde dehydrogenase